MAAEVPSLTDARPSVHRTRTVEIEMVEGTDE